VTLVLSSEQLVAVRSAVDAVPPNWQSRFLSALSDRLTMISNPSNREVLEAINQARRSFAIGHGPSAKDRAPYRRRA
jgi:hypothetical protein